MSGTLSAIGLPPREAIAFFAGKTNTTSQHWTDVWRTGHSRSFMVAGASTEALVADFRAEVAKALEQGTTLAEFRKGFDGIVERHGWAYNGTPGWRSRIIYETNLSTAYSAGRYAQMVEPDTLAAFPFWQYVHNDGPNPRLQHRAWNGLVLRADDPFWTTHYPPNGWRCGCRAKPLTARQLGRQGKTGPDQAPPITTRSWTNPRTGETSQVPVGIDPGFDYNPGQAWQGGRLPAIPGDARLSPPEGYPPRPLPIPPARPPAPPAPRPAAPDSDVVPVGRIGAAEPPDIPLPPVVAAIPAATRRVASAAVQRLDAALTDDFAGWAATLTPAEAGALENYKGAFGRRINDVLRGASAADDVINPARIEDLRSALARSVVRRKLSPLRGGNPSDVAVLANRAVGETVSFPWFLSSSIDPVVARDFARRGAGPIIELRIPRGARGVAYVHPFPRYRYPQREVLALPGLMWRIISRTTTRVVLELVTPT